MNAPVECQRGDVANARTGDDFEQTNDVVALAARRYLAARLYREKCGVSVRVRLRKEGNSSGR